MDRQELRAALGGKGIREDVYSLDDGMPEERLCMAREDGKWIVYYSERGNRSNLRRFDSEDEACRYVLKALCDDPTTRTEYLSATPPPWDGP